MPFNAGSLPKSLAGIFADDAALHTEGDNDSYPVQSPVDNGITIT